jgi:Kef-type K+ transport system membrane component KefB
MLRQEHRLTRTAIGMSMVPRGEVGLVFAGLGQSAGVFGPQVYAGVIIVIAYTTLLAPFWIKSFYKVYGDRPQLYQTSGEAPETG